jgi:hypothetical protein
MHYGCLKSKKKIVTISVADRQRFEAETDPIFYIFDADPNPDPTIQVQGQILRSIKSSCI